MTKQLGVTVSVVDGSEKAAQDVDRREVWKGPKTLRHNVSDGRGGGLREFVPLTSLTSRALARPPKPSGKGPGEQIPLEGKT